MGTNPSQLFFVIPARYASTRLPGKPLLKLGDKTLIEETAIRVNKCAQKIQSQLGDKIKGATVLVATDDYRIVETITQANLNSIMTPTELQSGTDRINYALNEHAINAQIDENSLIINIQGDEPFFCEEDIYKLVLDMLEHPETKMGTLAFPRDNAEMFFKSSVVKVIRDAKGFASYFSRAPIPWPRKHLGASGLNWEENIPTIIKHEKTPFLHHLGVYAYRRDFLRTFAEILPVSNLEYYEGLEQLRVIEAGYKIWVTLATESPFGVDTSEDLLQAINMIKNGIL